MNLKTLVSKFSDYLFSNKEECQKALQYLIEERHLTEDTIKAFSIGYCLENEFELYDQKTSDYKTISRISGSIIIPIRTEFGGVVAIAARKPDPQNKSSWWHTSFDKQNHLFMLDVTKKHIFDNNKAYIYEGYFDGIVCWQYGINNTCCLMSTNLGHRRIGFLARYCDHICLCYDSDLKSEAGQIAQMKSVYEMNRYGWENISKVIFPMGVDPDEFVIKNGKQAFHDLEKKLSKKEIMHISKEYERQFMKK